MSDVMQSAATSSSPLPPSQSTPLDAAAAKNPLNMSMGSSRFAGVIPKDSAPATPKAAATEATATSSLPLAPSQGTALVTADKNPLSMSMGTSRFAGATPKASAPEAPKIAAPKPSWNRELDFSSKTITSPPGKKGGMRYNKRRTERGQAPAKNLGHRNHPTSNSLSSAPAVLVPKLEPAITAPATPNNSPTKAALRPTAPVFVPRVAIAAATPSPPTSAPSSPTTSACSSEEPTSNSKENSKVQKEHIIYLQRLSKDGLKKDEIAKRTAAEFPDLCKGMRNGFKVATEETRLEAVGDAVFMHTMRYAKWYV